MSDARKPTPEDVAAWWTSGVSDIARNRIRLKGYAVEELMGNVGFADVIWLLLRSDLPTPAQRALLEAAMIGREVESALAKRTRKSIPMNVDGVTAAAFCELGFAAPLGRGLFCIARSVGALAHAWEEMQAGTRIKGPVPREATFKYVGPPDRSLGD